MIRTLTCTAAVIIAALSASAVSAGTIQDGVVIGDVSPRQEVISLDGVNLDNPSEAKAFYRSLQYAAARVCVDDSRACQREAVSDAVRQIGSPELVALDGGREAATQMADAGRSATSQR